MADFDTSGYDVWNDSRKRLRMTAEEFAAWVTSYHQRQHQEQEGLAEKCDRALHVVQCKDDPIPALGTDIDKWFLSTCGISSEGL